MSNRLSHLVNPLEVNPVLRPAAYYQLKNRLRDSFDTTLRLLGGSFYRIQATSFNHFVFYWDSNNYTIIRHHPYKGVFFKFPWRSVDDFFIKLKRYNIIT